MLLPGGTKPHQKRRYLVLPNSPLGWLPRHRPSICLFLLEINPINRVFLPLLASLLELP